MKTRICANVAMIVLALTGCGDGGPQDDGRLADSASHWLLSCEADSDCTDASCLCGVCTTTCDADDACGDGATCSDAELACGAPGDAICTSVCASNGDCGDGLACVSGACVRDAGPNTADADAGGDTPSDAGSDDTGPSDTGSSDVSDGGDADTTPPDATDTTDAGNDADAVDAADTADSSDTADAVDAADTSDAVDAADTSDAVDAADTSDAVDAADTADTADASDGVDDADTSTPDAGGGPVQGLTCPEGAPEWELVSLPAVGEFDAWVHDIDAHDGALFVLLGEQTSAAVTADHTYRVLEWTPDGWIDHGEPDVAAMEAETLGTEGVVWDALTVGPSGDVWIGGDAELGPLGPGRGFQLPVVAALRDGTWSAPEAIDLAPVAALPESPRGGSILDMDVGADGTVYAVGQASGWGGLVENNGSIPLVLEHDGTGWVERNVPDRDWPGSRGSTYASAVVTFGAHDMLGVGRHPGSGGALVLHDVDGDGPLSIATPADGVSLLGGGANDIAARSEADLWVVGDGTADGAFIMRRLDGAWMLEAGPYDSTTSLGSVVVLPDGFVWVFPTFTRNHADAETYDVTSAARFDGERWELVDLDAALALTAGVRVLEAEVDGDGSVWAAGFAYGSPFDEPVTAQRPVLMRWACPPLPSERAVGRLIDVPAGGFEMGCDPDRDDTGDGCNADELPLHEVTLTRGLQVMESEVTQGMWQARFGNNPAYFPGCGADCPVERVNWWEALAFANAASEADGLPACYELVNCVRTPGTDLDCEASTPTPTSGDVRDCDGYRLPTEAEWEYLARGGESHAYAGSDDPDAVAWHYDVSSTLTHAVCQKQRNGFGLCDMSGNVWEWTSSLRYDYPDTAVVDPAGGSDGLEYIMRGGHWYLDASWSRVARRISEFPGFQAFGLGFRLVRTAD